MNTANNKPGDLNNNLSINILPFLTDTDCFTIWLCRSKYFILTFAL